LSAKNDFRDAQMHVHKSGGRQPAVLGSAKVGGQKGLRYMLVPERGDLSQPAVVWENRPSRDGSGCLTDSRWNMLRNHPALTEVFARLAYVSRSWLHGVSLPDKTPAAVHTEFLCEKPHSRC
jgi:hypothetical protein